MTNEEYANALHTLYSLIGMAKMLPLDEMIERAERADIVAPMMDPTLWREKGQALREDIEMMKAWKKLTVKN